MDACLLGATACGALRGQAPWRRPRWAIWATRRRPAGRSACGCRRWALARARAPPAARSGRSTSARAAQSCSARRARGPSTRTARSRGPRGCGSRGWPPATASRWPPTPPSSPRGASCERACAREGRRGRGDRESASAALAQPAPGRRTARGKSHGEQPRAAGARGRRSGGRARLAPSVPNRGGRAAAAGGHAKPPGGREEGVTGCQATDIRLRARAEQAAARVGAVEGGGCSRKGNGWDGAQKN